MVVLTWFRYDSSRGFESTQPAFANCKTRTGIILKLFLMINGNILEIELPLLELYDSLLVEYQASEALHA